MDAVLFVQEIERMRKTDLRSYSDFANISNPHEMVAFVAKWSISHPKKTRAQDFMEKHPKARWAMMASEECGGVYKIPSGVCTYFAGYFVDGEVCKKEQGHLMMDIKSDKCIRCWLKHIKE